MIRWDAPGPVRGRRSRRARAASARAPFESLNLGRADRRRAASASTRTAAALCAEVGARAGAARDELPAPLGATCVRAQPRGVARASAGDGLWTDEPGLPVLAAHRRLPADRARTRRRRHARRSRSSTRAGAGCSPGSSQAGVRGARRRARVRGCDRARDRPLLLRGRRRGGRRRSARAFGADVVRDGKLDLWTRGRARAARGRLRAGRADRPLHGLLRRSASSPTAATTAITGSQGVAWRCRLSAVRANYERIRGGARPGRDRRRRHEVRLASTTWPCSPRPGSRSSARTAPRTSRPSTPRYGDAFRWHFIGHLQSRKATTVNAICELVPLARHRVGRAAPRDPGARRGQPLGRGDEVGRPGERARGLPGSLRRRPRPDDDAAARPAIPRRRGRTSAACASSRSARPAASSRWERARTTASPPRRARRMVRRGIRAVRRGNIPRSWDSETSGTARSSTSGSPRRRTTGTRTAT